MAQAQKCSPNYSELLKLHDFSKLHKFKYVELNVKRTPGKSFKEAKIATIQGKLQMLLGNGRTSTSIKEAVAKLLERNYPELIDVNGDNKVVIFVPDYFLNSIKVAKCIDPPRAPELEKNCKQASKNFPERKREFNEHLKVFNGQAISWYGEKVELDLYNFLKERSNKRDESLAVFHSLEILKFHEKNENYHEKDFIIINASLGIIMAIETKKALRKKNIQKTIEQLQLTFEDLQTYLLGDILSDEKIDGEDWFFIPMIYCGTVEEGITFDDSCLKHIMIGLNDVDGKLDSINEQVKRKRESRNRKGNGKGTLGRHPKIPQSPENQEEEFKSKKKVPFFEAFLTIFKYLAFVACAARAPITQKLLDETLERVDIAGESENIRRWCSWTPTQLSLMELAEKLPRVILIGGCGTGKTTMLTEYAMKMAKMKQFNVTFGVKKEHSAMKPLLELDLEIKFENLNISVKTVDTHDQLKDVSGTKSIICLDEMNTSSESEGQFNAMDLRAIEAKAIWIVVRDTKRTNSEDYLKEQFPGWVIVNLSYPLRTSKTISEKVKNGFVNNAYFINVFNDFLQLTSNMPLGPEPLFLGRCDGSYHQRLLRAFSLVPKHKSALIILESIWPTPEEIEQAKISEKINEEQVKFGGVEAYNTLREISISEQNKELYDKINLQEMIETERSRQERLLLGIEAVKLCKRQKYPPLIWFQSYNCHLSDRESDIKEWIQRKKEEFASRDLITDSFCVLGYEADFVIYMGENNTDQRHEYGSKIVTGMPEYMSRCRGQFVHIE